MNTDKNNKTKTKFIFAVRIFVCTILAGEPFGALGQIP